jgi:response regulator RpfG family c-di-GMP phosphodiesterase
MESPPARSSGRLGLPNTAMTRPTRIPSASRTSSLLAERVGCSSTAIEVLRLAAPLHDTGKLALPDSMLLTPGRLTDDEYEQVKKHANAGAAILSPA